MTAYFASVTEHLDKKSSHSLGKTTLIEIIDYCFLKQINKGSVLKKDAFEGFTFFLELKVSENKYVTIKRVVNGKISIKIHAESSNYSAEYKTEWDFSDLAFDTAKKELNQVITSKEQAKSGFNFRSGLRYCLRKQTQYENTFKVNTSREGDASWKPYLAYILGIKPEIVREKYIVNKKVESLKNAIKEVKDLPKDSGQSLEAEITQIIASVSRMQLEIDKFDFKKSDESVSKELVEDVANRVVDLNKNIYSLDQRLFAISKSLEAEFTFELNKVVSLFEEVGIYFPEQLNKSYDDLIKINTEMSSGRKNRLKETKKNILIERDVLNAELDVKRKRQQELSQILLKKDAFEKYKLLQNRLSKEESRLAVLKERLNKIDMASELGTKLEQAKTTQKEAAQALELETRVRGNKTLTDAVTMFSNFVDEILAISAFFYTETNKDGNLQFQIGLKDQTSVNEGFSYTRVLSAIFDLTLLTLNKNKNFYKFCYHDGLLESLDDRVKLKLLDTWRRSSESSGIQLIMSVLDSDLPLTSGGKAYFSKNEIVRELHDRGESGRLFKMKAF
jgi:uncharacterized protein YydD (DUF2326 family)